MFDVGTIIFSKTAIFILDLRVNFSIFLLYDIFISYFNDKRDNLIFIYTHTHTRARARARVCVYNILLIEESYNITFSIDVSNIIYRQ